MEPSISISSIGGTAEVAQLLGCQKQQIHALRKRTDFPKPFKSLSATPLWNLDEIRVFSESWARRPRG